MHCLLVFLRYLLLLTKLFLRVVRIFLCNQKTIIPVQPALLPLEDFWLPSKLAVTKQTSILPIHILFEDTETLLNAK